MCWHRPCVALHLLFRVLVSLCSILPHFNLAQSAMGVSTMVKQRMQDMVAGRLPGARPVLLFPEGTTTNGRYLLPFKTGAFLAGLPVKPVVMRYGQVGACVAQSAGVDANSGWLRASKASDLVVQLYQLQGCMQAGAASSVTIAAAA